VVLIVELNQRAHSPQACWSASGNPVAGAAGLVSELYEIDSFLTVEDSLSAAGGLQGASLAEINGQCEM
jgi:hypothetical protein